jgi:hypothetical protein
VLTPVILANQEAEISRIVVQSQPGQVVFEILSQNNSPPKKRASGVAQGEGPGRGRGEGRVMTQSLYAHMNKGN